MSCIDRESRLVEALRVALPYAQLEASSLRDEVSAEGQEEAAAKLEVVEEVIQRSDQLLQELSTEPVSRQFFAVEPMALPKLLLFDYTEALARPGTGFWANCRGWTSAPLADVFTLTTRGLVTSAGLSPPAVISGNAVWLHESYVARNYGYLVRSRGAKSTESIDSVIWAGSTADAMTYLRNKFPDQDHHIVSTVS